MAKYRENIREVLATHRFVGEGGLETTLIFDEGMDLPYFASFTAILKDRTFSEKWQKTFFDNARACGAGYWLDTKTWRANPDYGAKLGVDLESVWHEMVHDALHFRSEYETDPKSPILVSGVIGPRRDGYKLDSTIPLSIEDAQGYHMRQVEAFAREGVDVVSAYTINHFEEAAGIVLACKTAKVPVVISFTVEVDGRLASGETLGSVVRRVDEISGKYPLHYSINCAHPSHMMNAFPDSVLSERLRALFPNSSRKSHAELDESTELDRGEPHKIGIELRDMCNKFNIKPRVVGGCCGTGPDHVCNIGSAFANGT